MLQSRFESEEFTKPTLTQAHSHSAPTKRYRDSIIDSDHDRDGGCMSLALSVDPIPPGHSLRSSAGSTEQCQSCSTLGQIIPLSQSSSPRGSQASSISSPDTSAVEGFDDVNLAIRRRSTMLSRLKTTMSVASYSSHDKQHRIAVAPAEFQLPSEKPEKRFVDAIGMVLPGVCDRNQCAHPLSHFVSMFRLCDPIEYTTALADHGLTYTDYHRLITALLGFLEEHTAGKKRTGGDVESNERGYNRAEVGSRVCGNASRRPTMLRKGSFFDTTEQLKKTRTQASALSKLLEEITWNFQARGVPVMVCVNSFSLFAPFRISEAHIQIIHTQSGKSLREQLVSQNRFKLTRAGGQRLSFIEPFSLAMSDQDCVQSKPGQPAAPATSILLTSATCPKQHYHQSRKRDWSKPCPLWPNAIPSRKRQVMCDNRDRYGVDPYFRAWLRADINSRTRTSTYAKFMIECEDDPLVNNRLEYTESTSKRNLFVDVMINGTRAFKEQFPSSVNRTKYEHNRKLACRKATEHGSRLRLVRFGFRHPIYPPHTPEMAALGLSKDDYQKIILHIDSIQTHAQLSTKCPMSYMLASCNKIRRRSTEDALIQVSEYIRTLNAQQGRIVWTIEKIPGVYDRGLARDRTEWEISMWNAEDPLELLMQLEKWGIVEKRLSDDDED